ncbi:MAG: ATP-binding cassette domain-containing protein, partial [Acetobacteraceae bacterium]
MTRPVLEVRHLIKRYPIPGGLLGRTVAEVHAVEDVSFVVEPGETLCVVGESGCGKSTVGKLILRLLEPTSGQILIDGTDITKLGPAAMRPFRRRAQMVFQDPSASLNPRLSAAEIVTESIENYEPLSRAARRQRAAELLARVGL